MDGDGAARGENVVVLSPGWIPIVEDPIHLGNRIVFTPVNKSQLILELLPFVSGMTQYFNSRPLICGCFSCGCFKAALAKYEQSGWQCTRLRSAEDSEL